MLKPTCSFLLLASFMSMGCEAPETEELSETSQALVVGRPQGITCGLAYAKPYQVDANGACNGTTTVTVYAPSPPSYTLTQSAPVGFTPISVGDRGLASGWGFFVSSQTNSTGGVTTANSNDLLLPKGTACGFKESCNQGSSVTCLGFDANVSCPSGWTRKWAGDSNAPGGCNFVWCEYQDPNGYCSTSACTSNGGLPGIVCGITDSQASGGNIGQCLGVDTRFSCPSGWTRMGNYDWGRSSGNGVGWCTKL